MSYTGEYFDSLSSKSTDAEVTIRGKTAEIRVDGDLHKQQLIIDSIQDRRDIHFADGSLFILHHQLSANEVAQLSGKLARVIAWLEYFSPKRALILALIFVSAIILYRLVLLTFTPFAVAIFPPAWERKIGENAYQSLRYVYLKPSQLPAEQIDRLTTAAEQLLRLSELPESVTIKFHQSGKIFGPNALAFPGGPIVVTDELVELLVKDEQVLGVIAHEVAHIKHRHSLKQIVELVGVSVLVGIIFGANEALIEEASAIAVDLWALNLSRDFEREADLMGIQLLQEAEIDPIHFMDALHKLTRHFCEGLPAAQLQQCIDNESNNWLSTHPTGAQRLEYLEEFK